MRITLIALSIFLSGCSFQAGMALPKETFSKEEIQAGFTQLGQAIVGLDKRLKALEPQKEEIKK